MRVMIADDHDLVRGALCALLRQEADIETLEAATLDEALATLAGSGGVDLVLLDWGMPGMGGLEGLARCRAANPGGHVALISGVAPPDVARAALSAGAVGFLPKTLPARSLVNAVRFMASGERYAPVDFLTAVPGADTANPLAQRLSPREREVLGGLVRGLANKEIARELGLQEPTVKLHVKTLCRKIDARNRTHAAMIAKESGLF